MKKHFLKSFALLAMLFSALTLSAQSGVDWSTITWTDNGSGDAAATEKYKVSPAEGLSVVNIQKPGFSDEVGIYVTAPHGISECSINSKIDGAGVVMYLSSFELKETKVTITHAQGTITFWVYYEDGIDWSTIAWTGNGSDAVYTDKYKVSPAEGLSVVNIQKPGFSDEVGIYVTAPHGISECSINSKIDGAGVVLYLSSFEFKETKVTIKHAQGTITFWVYYADGIEGQDLGSNEEDESGWGSINWVTGSNNKYKVSHDCLQEVVSVQQPGWAEETGIYVVAKGTINSCTAAGAIQGGGMVIYLSNFIAKETEVTINYAGGSCTFWVYYADGIEGGGDTPATPSEVYDVNFALTANGSSATASSNPERANEAIDNNPGSRWESASADPQTWTLDLGQLRIFNTLEIVWEGAYGKTFTVSASDDKETWTPIWTVEGQELAGFPYTQTQKIDKTTARYIQFHGTERGTGYGYSFWEFRVYLAGESVLTTLETSVASCLVNQNGTTNISLVAKNQNGVVMDIVDPITYTITPADAGTITNNVFTASSKIGRATIVATVGSVQSVPVEIFTYGNEVAPAPTRNAEDVIAFYSDTYTPVVNLWGKSQWNRVNHKENEVSSNKYLHYSGGNWWGWEFGVNAGANVEGISSGVDCSAMEYLHIDIWGFENGTIRVIPIWGGTNLVENKALDTNDRYYALVEIRANQWNSVDIPLATGFQPEAEKHDFSSIFQFKFAERTTTAVAIDNVYFWKSAGTAPVESVTLDKTTATIEVDEALQLKATVLPIEAGNKNVIWTSSDATVATVVDGLVTGLKEGTTTITATSEENSEIKATCEITVEPITAKTWWGEPTTITVEGQEIAILYSFTRNEDKTITYTAIFGADKTFVKEINVESLSTGFKGLTYDANTLTASWNKTDSQHNKGEVITGFWWFAAHRIEFTYIVGSSNERPSAAVTSVTLDKISSSLLIGETLQLTAIVNPGTATNKAVSWSSDNTTVAEVNADGLVTAKAEGTATITVTTADGGKTAQCVITVSTPQVRTWWGTGEVTINEHDVDIIYSITHNLDKTLTYTVIFGDDTEMIRQVNARSVADVYHNLIGFDSANKTASYTSTTTHSSGDVITGFFYFGVDGVDFTYTVGSSNERPNPSVEGVALNHTTYDLIVNETLQLNATIYPGYAENKAMTWSSNNSAIAEVDANGLVTAKAEGTATIKVTTADGGKTATCTVTVIAALTESTYNESTYVKKDANAYLGINYSITRTSNRTLRYVVKVNNSEDVDLEFNVVVDGIWKRMEYNASANTYTYTTITTYADGDVVSGFFRHIKYGVEGRWDFNYEVGSISTTPRTMVAVNDEDADLTHLNNGSVYDVILKRNFVMDGDWNTISLPFALNASQINDIFGAGTIVQKLTSSELLSKTEINLVFEEVTSMDAATPYLIKPAQNVDAGRLLEDVTIDITPVTIQTDDAHMIPVLKTENFTGQDNTFFMGTNCDLWNKSADGKIKGMRAYFKLLNLTSEQLRNVRARVVFNENEATGLDNLTTEDAPIKIMQNGQLIIIRGGVKYNIQGQKL